MLEVLSALAPFLGIALALLMVASCTGPGPSYKCRQCKREYNTSGAWIYDACGADEQICAQCSGWRWDDVISNRDLRKLIEYARNPDPAAAPYLSDYIDHFGVEHEFVAHGRITDYGAYVIDHHVNWRRYAQH